MSLRLSDEAPSFTAANNATVRSVERRRRPPRASRQLPALLRGEDPDFVRYIERLTAEEGSGAGQP